MTIRSSVEAGIVRLSRALIARACRPLPDAERDERYREWAAELPAIPEAHRSWLVGLLAMVLFSADQFRTSRPARRSVRAAKKRPYFVSVVGVVVVASSSRRRRRKLESVVRRVAAVLPDAEQR